MCQVMGDAARLVGRLQVVGITAPHAVGQFGDFCHGLALLLGTHGDLLDLPGQLASPLLHGIQLVAHAGRARRTAFGLFAERGHLLAGVSNVLLYLLDIAADLIG